jgi:hypothetical protein
MGLIRLLAGQEGNTGDSDGQKLRHDAGDYIRANAAAAASRVPSMGRIYIDERSQSGPMTVTVAKRKV